MQIVLGEGSGAQVDGRRVVGVRPDSNQLVYKPNPSILDNQIVDKPNIPHKKPHKANTHKLPNQQPKSPPNIHLHLLLIFHSKHHNRTIDPQHNTSSSPQERQQHYCVDQEHLEEEDQHQQEHQGQDEDQEEEFQGFLAGGCCGQGQGSWGRGTGWGMERDWWGWLWGQSGLQQLLMLLFWGFWVGLRFRGFDGLIGLFGRLRLFFLLLLPGWFLLFLLRDSPKAIHNLFPIFLPLLNSPKTKIPPLLSSTTLPKTPIPLMIPTGSLPHNISIMHSIGQLGKKSPRLRHQKRTPINRTVNILIPLNPLFNFSHKTFKTKPMLGLALLGHGVHLAGLARLGADLAIDFIGFEMEIVLVVVYVWMLLILLGVVQEVSVEVVVVHLFWNRDRIRVEGLV